MLSVLETGQHEKDVGFQILPLYAGITAKVGVDQKAFTFFDREHPSPDVNRM